MLVRGTRNIGRIGGLLIVARRLSEWERTSACPRGVVFLAGKIVLPRLQQTRGLQKQVRMPASCWLGWSMWICGRRMLTGCSLVPCVWLHEPPIGYELSDAA